MIRRILPLVTLSVLFAFFALAHPAGAGAQAKKQIQVLATKVAITSVTFLPSGCGVEVDCFEVKWNVQFPPANPQVMTFEVNGSLITSNNATGACKSNVVTINDHTARVAKVGFFQASPCGGQIKSANMTVKLFTRDIEGQKVLTSTANKTQIIQP